MRPRTRGQENLATREAPRNNNNKQSIKILKAHQRAYGRRSPLSKQFETLRARQRVYGRRSPFSKQSETLKAR